jgi:hypothetical protein
LAKLILDRCFKFRQVQYLCHLGVDVGFLLVLQLGVLVLLQRLLYLGTIRYMWKFVEQAAVVARTDILKRFQLIQLKLTVAPHLNKYFVGAQLEEQDLRQCFIHPLH